MFSLSAKNLHYGCLASNYAADISHVEFDLTMKRLTIQQAFTYSRSKIKALKKFRCLFFNFKDISHLFLRLLFGTLNMYLFSVHNFFYTALLNVDNAFLVRNIGATIPADVYLFKFNNRSTRKRRKMCSKLTIKTTSKTLFWCLDC